MVDTKCLEQSSCPTGTLTVKHRQVGRSFRPTASIRNLNNLIRTEKSHMYPTMRVMRSISSAEVPSYPPAAMATERSKRPNPPGNIRHTIDCRPSHLTNQVGTHVFEVLEKRNQYAGSPSTICPSFTTHPFAINIVPLTGYLFIGRYDGAIYSGKEHISLRYSLRPYR